MPAASKNRPSDEELRRLYVDQGLTAQAIGDRCRVEKITALRWLKAAGIERRPASGLARRGVTPPTREELVDLVHVQHLGYRRIAERYGVDPTAVPHWLTKHGIERPTIWGTRRRGVELVLPDEGELTARRAAGESLTTIAADYGVSRDTIRDLCLRLDIAYDRDGWLGGKRFTATDGHKVRSTYELRVDDWLTDHDLAHEPEPRYPFDRRYRADFLVNGVYVEVWGVMHNPAYNQRRAWKIQQCTDHGLTLIQINYGQFAGRRRWWRPLEVLLEDRAAPEST